MTAKKWHSPIWIEKRACEYAKAVNEYVDIGNQYDKEKHKKNPSVSKCNALKSKGDKKYKNITNIYNKLKSADVRMKIFEKKRW